MMDRALVELAARLYVSEQIATLRQALDKAAQQLGQRLRWPEHGAGLQQAVVDYQRLFCRQAWQDALRHKRQTALQAMQLLADYQPRLSGVLVSGAIHARSAIDCVVFSDPPEGPLLVLQDAGIPVRPWQSSLQFKGRINETFEGVRFMAGDDEIRLLILPERYLRQRPLDPLTGQDTEWIKLTRLRQWLEDGNA